jgi:hypothetical protein
MNKIGNLTWTIDMKVALTNSLSIIRRRSYCLEWWIFTAAQTTSRRELATQTNVCHVSLDNKTLKDVPSKKW